MKTINKLMEKHPIIAFIVVFLGVLFAGAVVSVIARLLYEIWTFIMGW